MSKNDWKQTLINSINQYSEQQSKPYPYREKKLLRFVVKKAKLPKSELCYYTPKGTTMYAVRFGEYTMSIVAYERGRHEFVWRWHWFFKSGLNNVIVRVWKHDKIKPYAQFVVYYRDSSLRVRSVLGEAIQSLDVIEDSDKWRKLI